MRVFKRRESGVWYFDGRDVGMRKISLKTKDKSAAQDFLKKMEYQHTVGVLELPKGLTKEDNKSDITLAESVDEFLDYCAGQIKQSTVKRYTLSAKHLTNHFGGNRKLKDIRPLDLEKYRSARISEGKKPATVNRDMQFLKSMINKLILWEILDDNPMKKIALYQENNIRTRILSFEEIRKLIETINEHCDFIETKRLKNEEKVNLVTDIREGKMGNKEIGEKYKVSESTVVYYKKRYRQKKKTKDTSEDMGYLKTIVMIALNTGMRKGEIMSLYYTDTKDIFGFTARAEKEKLNWLDIRRRVFIINDTKNNRARMIPINDALLDELKRYLEGRKEGPLFDIRDPKRAFHSACKKAGLDDVTFHDLRRTFISQMAMDGHSRELIQSIVGQVSEAVYKRYAHFSNLAKMNAVNSFGSKMSHKPEVLKLDRVVDGEK
jgi:integrase